MRRMALLIAAPLLLPASLACQEATFTIHTEADEIALARSAGPAEVSAEADIWVLRDDRFFLAERGSNGNACVVARGADPRGLYPICYDEEGARTVLHWEFRQHELRTAGHSEEEVTATLEKEIGAGELHVPRRPAMSYMLSAGQRLYPGGQELGSWKPHVMLYMPFSTKADLGLSENNSQVMMANEGRYDAFMVVVVPEFIHPGETAQTASGS